MSGPLRQDEWTLAAESEEQPEKIEQLFSGAPVGLCVLNCYGGVVRMNRCMGVYLGLKSAAQGSGALANLFDMDDQDSFRRFLRKCARSSTSQILEMHLSSDRAHARWVQVEAVADLSASGRLVQFQISLTDITRQKAIEADLRLLMDAGEILTTSPELGRTLSSLLARMVQDFAEVAFVDLLGADAKMVRTHPADPSADYAGRAAMVERIYPVGALHSAQAEVMTTGEPLVAELNGTWHRAEMRVSVDRVQYILIVVPIVPSTGRAGTLTLIVPVRLGNGKKSLKVAVALARRIADAHLNDALQARLSRTVQDRETFMGMVCHDLRNLLGIIELKSESLLRHAQSREEASRHGLTIRTLVRRTSRMLDDLLDTACIKRGQLSIRRESLLAREILSEAADSAQVQASKRSISLSVDVTSELTFSGDHERTLQVLANLLSNAIKFSNPAATVAMTARRVGDEVEFAVADQGIGFTQAALPHLFDCYWQAPRAGSAAPTAAAVAAVGQKDAKQGHGLGLSTARGIIEGSGGRIWAQSQLGRGSTFYFALPVAHSARRD